ncbi:hypothetical protein BcepF1.039 [Burkholderia phage BcepF1]|uniref:Uncharacterized protein n=1 Tax=Burkholderia phage BcepF1 TaxID=2886897 RepID=A1YZU3_9CAUD|nr:hypothetical protein BcepF1.039 [Burkholderia phage BcepF1]ABL96770.1 hypothetical protein BcepF1.039 [Burkholderia phage BcepF1]
MKLVYITDAQLAAINALANLGEAMGNTTIVEHAREFLTAAARSEDKGSYRAKLDLPIAPEPRTADEATFVIRTFEIPKSGLYLYRDTGPLENGDA